MTGSNKNIEKKSSDETKVKKLHAFLFSILALVDKFLGLFKKYLHLEDKLKARFGYKVDRTYASGKEFLSLKQSGKVISEAFSVSLVTIIFTTFTTTLGIVIDGIIIGRFMGATAIAAYGLATPLTIITFAVSGVVSAGAQSVCGNYLGKGEVKAANAVFNACIVLMLIISAVSIAAVVIFQDPLCMILGSSSSAGDMDAVNSDLKGYMVGFVIGAPFLLATGLIQPFMQLDNDRGRVLPTMLIMSGVNIAGDFFNVFVLQWGMFGMALMTSVSYVASTIVLLLHFRKPDILFKLGFLNLDWKGVGEAVSIGLPTAIARVCSSVRGILMNKQILALAGSTGVAALCLQGNSYTIFGCVGMAISGTTLLLCNIVYGEQDSVGIKAIVRSAIRVSIIGTGLVTLLLIIIAPFVAAIYVSEEPVIEMGTTAIRVCALSMPVNAIVYVFQSLAQASRKKVLTMVICILDNFACIIFCCYVLPLFMDLFGFWISNFIAELMVLAFYVLYCFFKNKCKGLTLDTLLMLPDNFDVPKEQKFEYSITDLEDVMMASFSAEILCAKQNIDERRAKAVSLCIEEMGKNVVEHGIQNPYKECLDIKVFITKDEDAEEPNVHIRLRDNCLTFNPIEHHKAIDPEDPMAGIGIRMIFKMAKDVNYVSTLRLNNLMIVV